MILTEQQIKDIVKNNPNKALVTAGKLYSKKLRAHIYGENIDSDLGTIDGFEKPTLRALRVKYASSNKDLICRLIKPIDKVFSSKGGSVYYNLANDKKARQIAADIRSGYSIKQWIESFWKPHFLDDPNGFIFMEIAPPDLAIRLKAMGKNYVYPTYKSISCVYDYLPNGSNLEYIIFHVDNNEKKAAGIPQEQVIYRVVDDSKDYYVRQDGEEITILNQLSFDNLFMKVPAMLNSDIVNPNLNGNMLSLLDEILELANQFLLKGSIKVTHDFMHGFPKYWEYADSCDRCKGTGMIEGETCPDCKGTSKRLMTKVSDVKLLSYPQTKEDATVTPNVAGYVSPDKTYWEIATADLQLLEDLMNYTLWGANPMQKTQGMSTDKNAKTATEIMSDVKPQSDRLHPITESAEKRHKFILDSAIQISINQNYQGATVNYGKRYMLEGPDVIWEKYQDARAKGAAMSILDDLLMEYYEAKYDSDPVKLAIQSKLMKVEPFVHLTTLQLKSLTPAEEDYKEKLYFGEWLSTLNDAMILSFSIDELKTQLKEAVSEKTLLQPEAKQIAA